MKAQNSKSLFSEINGRIERDKEEGDIAYLQALLLKLEFLTKVVTAAVVACLDDDRDRSRYSLERRLVRADSLGEWSAVLQEALVGPAAQCFRTGARSLRNDLTKRVSGDDWRREAVGLLAEAASALHVEVTVGAREPLRRFFQIAVQVRNRTRGHGATRSDQAGDACPSMAKALSLVEETTGVLGLPWAFLRQNLSGKYRVTPLLGETGSFEYLKRKTENTRLADGVYLHLESEAAPPVHVPVPLVFSDVDLRDVYVPNGKWKNSANFQVLSYSSNDSREVDGSRWVAPPNELPASETQGQKGLEVVGSLLTNAPPPPSGYVKRHRLEAELRRELFEPFRHRIVTLNGRGGIGKTALALTVIRGLSDSDSPPYDVVLWLSARDVDLLDSGPKPVSPGVFGLLDVARAAAEILDAPDCQASSSGAREWFEENLREGADGVPTLFVIDNFETLQDPTEVFEWIDYHVRAPNKVVITTRSRDFRGDFPVKVTGMAREEASQLIDSRAEYLGLEEVSPEYRAALIEQSEGHPYIIRLALGEARAAGRKVTPLGLLPASEDVLEALFRRTFDALSAASQRVFLLLSSWRVDVPEVAVEAVMRRRPEDDVDVDGVLQEVVGYSLAERSEDGQAHAAFVNVPLAASLFGKRELKTNPLRAAVREDRGLLMDFGADGGRRSHGVGRRIDNLVRRVARRASDGNGEVSGEDVAVLEYLADRFPLVYLRLAELVTDGKDTAETRERARFYLRRYIQEADGQNVGSAWEKMADLRGQEGDGVGEVQALCEAAVSPGRTLVDVSRLANRVNEVIYWAPTVRTDHAWRLDREMILSEVIEALEAKRSELSGTDCSRLAWLYVNAGHPERGIDVARAGLEREPGNLYCARFVERFTN